MLIYSMSVSVDGFIADREGAFGWTVPSEELFRFHISQVRELGGYLLGRRLYETMLPWETDPSMRDKWCAEWCAPGLAARLQRPGLPKGRWPRRSLALAATDKDVSIGGAGLAAAAIELGLVGELRMFRVPVVVGGGTPFCRRLPRWSLDLVETRTFGSRVIYERYRQTRDEPD